MVDSLNTETVIAPSIYMDIKNIKLINLNTKRAGIWTSVDVTNNDTNKESPCSLSNAMILWRV